MAAFQGMHVSPVKLKSEANKVDLAVFKYGMSVLFSWSMGNESERGTNAQEPLCVQICPVLQFIPHESRKKNNPTFTKLPTKTLTKIRKEKL